MGFPLHERFVQAAETELGVRFPDWYRSRQMSNNGAELALGEDGVQLWPIKDDSDRKRLSRTANHVVREHQSARESAGFPSDVIAIGADGCGNYVVLRKNTDGTLDPALCFWHHETAEVSALDVDPQDL